MKGEKRKVTKENLKSDAEKGKGRHLKCKRKCIKGSNNNETKMTQEIKKGK